MQTFCFTSKMWSSWTFEIITQPEVEIHRDRASLASPWECLSPREWPSSWAKVWKCRFIKVQGRETPPEEQVFWSRVVHRSHEHLRRGSCQEGRRHGLTHLTQNLNLFSHQHGDSLITTCQDLNKRCAMHLPVEADVNVCFSRDFGESQQSDCRPFFHCFNHNPINLWTRLRLWWNIWG